MTANGLKLLMGDYNSDSETDEDVTNCPASPTPTRHRTKDDLNVAVDAFVSELEAASAAETSNPVPSNVTSWTQCIDKATGHPYYWHPDTKEVTWEIPAEYQAFLDANADLLSDSNVANMWTVCYTEEGGSEPAQRYYVNEYTRMVSWDRPIAFVEPADVEPRRPTPDTDAPVSKNVIKRRRKVPTPKAKRENPYSKPTEAERVKIELISSFSTKSDSSSEGDEDNSNSKLLKLVAADYNSDTDTSALDTSGVLCATVPKIAKKITHERSSSSQSKEEFAGVDSNDTVVDRANRKATNTFASIITGGRSPEQDHRKDSTPAASETVDPKHQDSRQNTDEVLVKTQKRKRRIEFITKAPEVADTDVTTAPAKDAAKVADTRKNPTNMYANFKHSHVEFVDHTDEPDVATAPNELKHSVPEATTAEASDVDDLKDLIEAKLKFLCDGRPEVSAVQAILIQLETLFEAYEEGAIQKAYLSKWLDGIATDLHTLELGAAPTGWKCRWNRSKAQYCYVHQRSGEVRWDYPTTTCSSPSSSVETGTGPDGLAPDSPKSTPSAVPVAASKPTNGNGAAAPVRHDDDAMDICTTPPPAADPACPKTTLPPGTDAPDGSLSITSELASFYSDLATIESMPADAAEAVVVSAPQTGVAVSAGQVVAADSPAASSDESAGTKKKKRKVRKLEPWRTGNLETWIDKWAKAQQELEN